MMYLCTIPGTSHATYVGVFFPWQGERDRGTLKGKLDDYMVTDEVVASTAKTMEDTLRYLDCQYGGIQSYLQIIGISTSEAGPLSLHFAVWA